MSVMTTHAPVVLEQASQERRADADVHGRSVASADRPTFGETLAQTVPLISAPAFFGPPVIFLLGPWLLLVLLLIPPAAFLITLMAVFLLAAGLLVAVGALIASPYLLVRHLRARHSVAPPAPVALEVAGGRSERRVEKPVTPRLIHLTTR